MDNGNRLYVCGTNAHNPKDYVIYVSIPEKKISPEKSSLNVRIATGKQFIKIMNITNCLQQ